MAEDGPLHRYPIKIWTKRGYALPQISKHHVAKVDHLVFGNCLLIDEDDMEHDVIILSNTCVDLLEIKYTLAAGDSSTIVAKMKHKDKEEIFHIQCRRWMGIS